MNARDSRWIWILVFCLTLPAGVVLSTDLARRSFEKVRLGGHSVNVKGYAEKRIVSNRGNWRGTIYQRQLVLADAYKNLEADRAKLLAVLADNGFAADTVAIEPVSIETLYKKDAKGNRTNSIEAYVVGQPMGVWSDDVNKIDRAARAVSALIGEGVELQANTPTYLFTDLDSLKLEMLAAASDNARQRASKMVEGTGSRLGAVVSASQGVFQITPAYSTEVSDMGENDTTSIGKMVKAVVTVEFGIEK